MRFLALIFLLFFATSCIEKQEITSEATAKTESIFQYDTIEMDIPSDWQEKSSLHITTFINKNNDNLNILGHSFGSAKLKKENVEKIYLAKLKKRFTSIEMENSASFCDGQIKLFKIKGTLLKRPYASSKSYNKRYNFYVLSALIYTSNNILNFWVDGATASIEKELQNFESFLSSYREVHIENYNRSHCMEPDEIILATLKSLKPNVSESGFDFGEFSLEVPKNWIQIKPEKEMRLAEFLLKEHREYSVVAFHFGKMDLPVDEIVSKNAMRWRRQFKKLEEEKEIPLKHKNLALIYYRGTFVKKKNFMDAEGIEIENFCVLNAVIPSSAGPYYFRLEAPKKIIDKELDNLKAFLNSYSKKNSSNEDHEGHDHGDHEGHDHEGHAHNDGDSHSDRSSNNNDPHVNIAHDGDSHSDRSTDKNEVDNTDPNTLKLDNLSFTIPSSWEKVAPKNSMRKAQFRPRNYPKYAIPVFHFGLDQFSTIEDRIEKNADRWEKQFQKIDEKKILKLKIPYAALVYLSGTYTVKSSPFASTGTDTPGYAALNALIDTEKGPYFFRLVAPKEVIEKELPAFEAFLNSCKNNNK